MKRRVQQTKGKLKLQKKNYNIPNIQSFFKMPLLKLSQEINSSNNNNHIKFPNSKSSELHLIKNPSINSDSNKDFQKINENIEKYILINSDMINILCTKLFSSFEKIHFFLAKSKMYNINQIDIRNLITKFILQLKYIDIIYISENLYSDDFDEEKISENIKNFCGYNNIKNITINSYPNTKEEYNLYIHNIYDIISNYLNFPYESKGLYIYVREDYLSYFQKIKLICNLFNFELKVIDETIETKNTLLDKISEAMKTKRLPSIPEQIDYQLNILEGIAYYYNSKWSIFNKEKGDKNNDGINTNINNGFNHIQTKYNNNLKTISLNSESESIIDLNSFNNNSNNIIHIIDENTISNNETIHINQDSNKYSTSEILLNLNYYNFNKEKGDLEMIKDKNKNFKENLKENNNKNKLFDKIQNNIFSFCNKAKTAILIIDSFSNGESDKKYFNNILSKISQTKCPIIILSNNIEYIINSTSKKLKNLKINLIPNNESKSDKNLIYLYSIVLYLNIKLAFMKFSKNIKSYEDLMKIIKSIEPDKFNYELNNENLQKIYDMSKCLCYKYKFQIDAIDFKLSEMIFSLEKEQEIFNKINDFNIVLDYFYIYIFEVNENNLNNYENVHKISEDYDFASFLDCCDKWEKIICDKIYEEKIKMNDYYDNYLKNKDNMVNLENITLDKYLNSRELFMKFCDSIINEEKKYIFTYFNNNIMEKIYKESQTFFSFITKKYISIKLIILYNYSIYYVIKEENYNNKKNKIFNKLLYFIN